MPNMATTMDHLAAFSQAYPFFSLPLPLYTRSFILLIWQGIPTIQGSKRGLSPKPPLYSTESALTDNALLLTFPAIRYIHPPLH